MDTSIVMQKRERSGVVGECFFKWWIFSNVSPVFAVISEKEIDEQAVEPIWLLHTVPHTSWV